MAKMILKDARFELNGTNYSDHVRSVTITTASAEVDLTAMGSAFEDSGKGLGSADVEVEFYIDFAAASIDSVLWPLATSDTTCAIKIRPTSAAISPTNPSYEMTARVFSYNPLAGAIGDALTSTVPFKNASQTGLTRVTA